MPDATRSWEAFRRARDAALEIARGEGRAQGREEGRQQGRREVLDVVREQEEIEEGQYQRMKRGWLPYDEWGPQSHAYASQLLETIARECDTPPAEETEP